MALDKLEGISMNTELDYAVIVYKPKSLFLIGIISLFETWDYLVRKLSSS